MAHQSDITTDHDTIRRWVEARGGRPATVERTGRSGEAAGILRIDFPDADDEEEHLQHISWEDWFRRFEESGLAMVLQEGTSGGQTSRFNKLVARERET